MGKRSNFEKMPRDLYITPKAAVEPLIPFLPNKLFAYAEPCAADGTLCEHIAALTEYRAAAVWKSDIEPLDSSVQKRDATTLTDKDLEYADYIITNPPWSRDKASGFILHRMIETFTDLRPTWLLFDSDWMHTKQAHKFMDRLVCSVSIGRVKWIENSKMTGKDNASWYLFDKRARKFSNAPLFFGKGYVPDQLPKMPYFQ